MLRYPSTSRLVTNVLLLTPERYACDEEEQAPNEVTPSQK